MSRVSIVKCKTYESNNIEDSIKQAIELIGGLKSIIKPNSKVLIKPNLLSPKSPEKAVTTHPSVVAAVVRYVRELGAIAIVGDSSGGAIHGQPPTNRAFETTGIREAAESAGATVVNFDTEQKIEVPVKGNPLITTLYLTKWIKEADCIINLPKLKTHSASLFTGAIKNMYGTVPGLRKAEYHRLAPQPKDFSRIIVEIFAAAKPQINIMDGVIAMEGEGPSAGAPKKLGIVLASFDAVSLDAVASKIIGFNPYDILITKEAANKGLGNAELGSIEIVGAKLADVLASDFKLPSNTLNIRMNRYFNRVLFKQFRSKPKPNRDICTGCGICQENCPVNAINIKVKFPEINKEKCIDCLCCQELCPRKAIDLVCETYLGRALSKWYLSRSAKRRKTNDKKTF